MEVYVVTKGSYSDYHIEAVFSTREKAASYIGMYPEDAYNKPEIEEWELDGEQDKTHRLVHHVWLYLADGSAHKYHQAYTGAELLPVATRVPDSSTALEPDYFTDSKEIAVVKATSYVSPEHALKLAAEARQAWLREQGAKAQG